MAPRNRRSEYQDLPENLYANGPYFRYRHPITKQYTKFGQDRDKAIKAAKHLNARLEQDDDLIRRALGEDGQTWGDLVEAYRAKKQLKDKRKAGTVKNEGYRLDRIQKDFGNKLLDRTTQKMISSYLNLNFTGDPYVKHRGTLIKLMAFGIAEGMFVDGFKNLAAATLPGEVEEKVKQILTIEQFHAIHEVAEPWLQIAMDFAIVTLQRRGDIIKARYTDIKGDELYVVQNKTEKHGERAYLRIGIGATLKQIIARSRQDGICPFIIHRKPDRMVPFEGQEHPWQVRDQFLTIAFNKARDKTKLFKGWAPGTPPTFHEIRALGGDQYLKQGYSKEYVNLLMGHTTQKMTDSYTDQHENWTRCAAELKL